jgi:hypothetical protein
MSVLRVRYALSNRAVQNITGRNRAVKWSFMNSIRCSHLTAHLPVIEGYRSQIESVYMKGDYDESI